MTAENLKFVLMVLFIYSSALPAAKKYNDNYENKIEMDNLFAWCIVPYDSKNRTPEERILMLKELGFKSYAYDWRLNNLDEMEHEWNLSKENNINIIAVWMWIDAELDKPGRLNMPNEKVFETLKKTGLKTQIWLGFHPNYFEDLNDNNAVQKGVEMIKYLSEKAKGIGCKVALYNHGDWFGEPENEVKIINSLPGCEIGIVYNFHHGHEQIDRFTEILKAMRPYLWAVNLNGMKKEGPKILTIGKGDYEKKMIQMLFDSGFTGPYGIIGHIETEDVKEVLQRNIDGLRAIGY